MFVNFKELPDDARIWIYQSNRPFTDEELQELKIRLADFLDEWTAHGSSLKASYQIPYNRFLVIGLDQSQAEASGCSIDASVHFIQELQNRYDVDLLDRMNVTFKQGEHLAYKDLKEFKSLVKNKGVSAKTIVFNNLVNTKKDYLESWEVPLKESWHARFL